MIYLERFISDRTSTKGIIHDGKRTLCHTLELPWNNNKPFISCIPQGIYQVSDSTSTKFARCFRFPSVTGRSGILIHAGNSISDTLGCILVGLDITDKTLIHSQQAMDRLFHLLPSDFQLNIRSIS